MPRKELTDEEKAANVAKGLTPTGRERKRKQLHAAPRRVDKAVLFPVGDYRTTGHKFTESRKQRYLEKLYEEGDKYAACAAIGVGWTTVAKHRSSDPEFREAMDAALEAHGERYVREARRRAVEGVEEPVFGSLGGHEGSGIVGTVKKFSDRLLLELIKRYVPEFTPKQRIESEDVTPKGSEPLGLGELTPESQNELREILERERLRREEAGK